MHHPLRVSSLLFALAALVGGCSDSNPEALAEAHPLNWYQLHRTATTTAAFVNDCGGCHVVSAQPGPVVPPSCFSSTFEGRRCHARGPGAPHPLDGSFLAGTAHGRVAKGDLTFCQGCHSSTPDGGPGSNPRFDTGIFTANAPAPGTGCEQCHGLNYAHPADWAGPNATFHYSAGNIQAACTLCHGASLDGAGGVGVNCRACHAETAAFTLDCAACHRFPPDGATAEPLITATAGILVDHGAVPLDRHDQCATCHGVKNNGAGSVGALAPSANYLPFAKATDTLGDHWNGRINMNSGVGYNPANFGCDLACHGNDAQHRLSDSNLPVALGDYGSGLAPHFVGSNWLLVSQHAAAAVNGLLACAGCHTQTGGGINPPCQGCHQVAPRNDLTTAGCSSCHGFPPDGVTPVATQPNRAGKHGKHANFTADTVACRSCHQGGGSDSPSHYDRLDATTPNFPAEVGFLAAYHAKSGAAAYNAAAQTCARVSCHGGVTTPDWSLGALPSVDPATGNQFCLSCHISGNAEFNSFFSGEHDFHLQERSLRCVVCHNTTVLQNGVGGLGPSHWSNLDTPAFELAPAATVGGGSTSAIYNGATCTNAAAGCHPGDRRPW